MNNLNNLIDSTKSGDKAAFTEIVSLYYTRIYNYCLRYDRDKEIASDVTQETFIAVFKDIKKLKDNDGFKPWIYRIATNLLNEEFRRRAKRTNENNKLVLEFNIEVPDDIEADIYILELLKRMDNYYRSIGGSGLRIDSISQRDFSRILELA